MISGNVKRKIKKYLLKDLCTYVTPKNGIEFFGIPFSYYSTHSEPFIEHRLNNILVVSVNLSCVAEITFEATED